MEKSSDITIRKATSKDVAIILKFIRELAEFEKLSRLVEANEIKLKSTLFGKKPVAKVLIAEIKNKPIGFLLYFYNYSTFVGRLGIYIEDLYVNPKYRKKGVGRALMKHCVKIAKKLGYKRVEWAALTWNPARKFYKKIGAQPLNDWVLYRLSEKKLKEFADS
jgi:GNAT superfamily N-acetyltransferase